MIIIPAVATQKMPSAVVVSCIALAACGGGDSASEIASRSQPQAAAVSQDSASRDSQAPRLAVHWQGKVDASGQIDVFGTANDDSAIVRVSWSSDRGQSGNALLQESARRVSWAVRGLQLHTGDNLLTFFAEDSAGNRSEGRTLSINRPAEGTDPGSDVPPPPPAPAPVTTPTIERVELVASDALARDSVTITNTWGGHQLRVSQHNDGTVRALYLRKTVAGELQWSLMRRPSTGGWQLEVSGPTTDDINLVRDPSTDRASVLSWPGSAPTVQTSPDFTAQPIAGSWPYKDSGSRRYGAVGVGVDRTLCLKATLQTNTTADTTALVTCGKPASTGTWSWLDQLSVPVGMRHAYDYVFPGAGSTSKALVITGESDVNKSVLGLPNLAYTWVFNGVRLFNGTQDSASGWTQPDIAPPIPIPTDATVAASVLQLDTLIDSKGRVLTIYQSNDPTNSAAAGKTLVSATTSGTVTSRTRLADIPVYGAVRIVEGAAGRLWLLWANKGSSASQFRIYPLLESGSAGAPIFTIGAPTDQSAAFAPYMFDSGAYLAAVRGGQARSNIIDGILAACETLVDPMRPIEWTDASCYPSGTQASQRVLYFRLHLPG